MRRAGALLLVIAVFAGACTGGGGGGGGEGTGREGAGTESSGLVGPAPEGTTVSFVLDGSWVDGSTFYDHPWPSDLCRTAEGNPDWTGFPNPNDSLPVTNLLPAASEHPGFPVNPVAWFRFAAPLEPRELDEVIPDTADAPLLLVDVVARTLEPDAFTPDNVLAVSPAPGHVLVAGHTYAFVVQRSLDDAEGDPLGAPDTLHRLAHGQIPDVAGGEEAAVLFEPLWPALDSVGVAADDVAAATVFTTGDVVADLATMSEGLRDRHDDLTLDDLRVDPFDGADHDRFCELEGTVRLPQFQQGTPPFDTEGRFELGDDEPIPGRWPSCPLAQADSGVSSS